MKIARVEPLTTARSLRGPFDYRLTGGPDRSGEPPGPADPGRFEGVGVGSVLRVPFGHRRILAIVTGLAEASDVDPERLLAPLEVIGSGTTPELVELALWLAEAYCSTPARGLGLVLPPGTGAGGARVRERTEAVAALTDEGRRLIGELDSEVDGRGPEGPARRLGSRQRQILEALIPGELPVRSLGGAGDALRRLERRGLVSRRPVAVRRRARVEEMGGAADAPELTADQRAAAERLAAGLVDRSGPGDGILLAGVTGSGKTEVYLATVERALEAGRTAIVLVPEIGLTPQAVSRFRARLGDRVAVLHSALSAGERFDEWQRLRTGDATVCVGPRSAVFAPLSDLGLIIVDEEHDPSYKQEGDPRYDAREVARRRAERAGALLVLGSATPRPETWLGSPRVELPRRVDGIGMPPVELIDMRESDPRRGPLHEATMAALLEVREQGRKAIVMVNRRGFSPWLTCRTCGHHWGCPNCDVSLIVHREGRLLLCHHCAHAEPLPDACPTCGGTTLANVGAGTQRLERALAEQLDPMPVIRLDADTASARGGHGRILAAFEQLPSAVLVGTQMVAKGHDFPEVTLSAIVDADATLRFPDFRAEERTFSLVTQLAGRSGRGPRGGRVIVQTLAPSAPSIAAAAEHDSAGFLSGELERRRALRYPPYSHLIGVRLAAEREGSVDGAAADLRQRLRDLLPPTSDLLGPAPMFRARNRHRRRFMVKSPDRLPAVESVRRAVESLATEGAFRQVSVSVDVDPQ